MRIAWLENLGQVQRTHDNPAEAAHTKLHQAALVLQYLEQSGDSPLPIDTLLAAVPNHAKELGLPPFEATEFASKVWTKVRIFVFVCFVGVCLFVCLISL